MICHHFVFFLFQTGLGHALGLPCPPQSSHGGMPARIVYIPLSNSPTSSVKSPTSCLSFVSCCFMRCASRELACGVFLLCSGLPYSMWQKMCPRTVPFIKLSGGAFPMWCFWVRHRELPAGLYDIIALARMPVPHHSSCILVLFFLDNTKKESSTSTTTPDSRRRLYIDSTVQIPHYWGLEICRVKCTSQNHISSSWCGAATSKICVLGNW